MYQAKKFGTHSIRWLRGVADQLPALLDDWDTWIGIFFFTLIHSLEIRSCSYWSMK
jgi:hypothetical protein